MKQNVLLIANIETYSPPYIQRFKKGTSNLLVTDDFYQVKALALLSKIKRLAIIRKASEHLEGQTAANLINEIDPDIPILVWDGRVFLPGTPQSSGSPQPILYKNQAFTRIIFTIHAITADFFKGLRNPNRGLLI